MTDAPHRAEGSGAIWLRRLRHLFEVEAYGPRSSKSPSMIAQPGNDRPTRQAS